MLKHGGHTPGNLMAPAFGGRTPGHGGHTPPGFRIRSIRNNGFIATEGIASRLITVAKRYAQTRADRKGTAQRGK